MAVGEWQIYPAAPGEVLDTARSAGIPDLLTQLLHNRGIAEIAAMSAFLDPTHLVDVDPFRLRDMGRAVARVRQAIRDGEQIAVYGDYDADGLTATALLTEVLTTLGGQVTPYIPHRVDEGYGLRTDALEGLRAAGVKLVITVDCGISGVQEVRYGQDLGLDFVITDHHELHGPVPAAVAVVNPKRDNLYPFRELAGVGVAFKLAQAMLSELSPKRLVEVQSECLDLVAIGTVADVVPLLGENRYLVQQGLRILNETRRPGLLALLESASLSLGSLDESHISFGIAPRLNAAGRVDDAWTAYRLLVSKDPREASDYARTLEERNGMRQRLTEDGLNRARQLCGDAASNEPVIVVQAEGLALGVVGLIASKLCEEYGRPAIVLARDGDECRGSARSVSGFDISSALAGCADLLDKYGGHPMAAGLTVRADKVGILRSRLQSLGERALGSQLSAPVLMADAELRLSSVDWGLYRLLRNLPPHGLGNPEPLFVSRGLHVHESTSMGRTGSILKLILSENGLANTLVAKGFGMGASAPRMPRKVDLAYSITRNEWRGQQNLELRIKDFRPTTSAR